jgi:DNA polymerase-3 subunit delta
MCRRQLERLLEQGGGGFERQVFRGDAEDFPGGYWQALGTVSLFAKPRAVILRRAEILDTQFWDGLTRFLAGFSQHVWPIICLEGSVDPAKGPSLPKGLEKRPYWKNAQTRGWVWISPGLTAQTLPGVLRDWAASRRLSLGSGVGAELARLLPMDMTAAARELEKLELAAGDNREIGLAQLGVVSTAPVMETFAFLRSMASGKDQAGVWRKVMDSEMAGDDGLVFQFLGLLRYDAKVMWQVTFGEEEGLRLSPYARKEREAVARRLGIRGLARLWDLAMMAESAIKSGERSPEQTLEKLAADLMGLFAA